MKCGSGYINDERYRCRVHVFMGVKGGVEYNDRTKDERGRNVSSSPDVAISPSVVAYPVLAM
jgi:hypothetical protein